MFDLIGDARKGSPISDVQLGALRRDAFGPQFGERFLKSVAANVDDEDPATQTTK